MMFTISDAAGSVTWFEPPPVETVSDHTIVHTNSTQLRKGSTNVNLRWEFSLTSELNLITVNLRFDGANAGTIVPSTGVSGVDVALTSRFNISWVARQATLVIFNVSTADEGLLYIYTLVFKEVDISNIYIYIYIYIYRKSVFRFFRSRELDTLK